MEEGKEFLPPTPRHLRTPLTEAAEVISRLCGVWDGIVERTQPNSNPDFMDVIFGPMFRDENSSGDKQLAEMESDLDEKPEEAAKFALMYAILITCAYAVQALKAAKANADALHSPDAWRYAAEARYWEGIVVGTWTMKSTETVSIVDVAKKGAEARHAKNREYKAKAIAAFQEGNFKSKDEAAEKIAGTVVPLTFRAVRDYLKGL